MDWAIVIAVVIALAVGVLVGWLLGSRDGAGAKQTVDNLRMQLNGVSAERDQARTALDSASRTCTAC